MQPPPSMNPIGTTAMQTTAASVTSTSKAPVPTSTSTSTPPTINLTMPPFTPTMHGLSPFGTNGIAPFRPYPPQRPASQNLPDCSSLSPIMTLSSAIKIPSPPPPRLLAKTCSPPPSDGDGLRSFHFWRRCYRLGGVASVSGDGGWSWPVEVEISYLVVMSGGQSALAVGDEVYSLQWSLGN
nr:hypothetical protein Iba_chr12bCG17970 [Ipomoea batatas]